MAIVVEATFERGILRPDQPLPLKEHERVRITVETQNTWAERTAGIIRWAGDAKTLEHFALDPGLDPQEEP